ncbi:MAG: hypothetical protein H6523_12990 [Mycolicibacterium sp.]|nr:hypothetical protein [Mycolicibacterium sp.]
MTDDSDVRVPDDAGEHAEALRAILSRFEAGSCRAIDCGPGWYSLLADLDAALARLDPAYTLRQVKEKFGGLRFYLGAISSDDDAVYALIREAEGLSELTCELCGEPGRLRGELGWVRTLCDGHYAETVEAKAQEWRAYAARVETAWPEPRLEGAGWTAILERMRRDLRRVDPTLYAMQIAQHDGALEVFCWPTSPELRAAVQARVAEAVAEAAVTCQRCAGPGESRDISEWAYVLCQPCAELYQWEHSHGLEYVGPTSTTDLHGATRTGNAPRGPVLIQLADGSLAPCAWPGAPRTLTVQAVERDGQLAWVRADADALPGDRPLGAPIPAMVLREQRAPDTR